MIGGLGFWLVGYGLAFGDGDNGIIGTTYFASIGVPQAQYPHMFFQVNTMKLSTNKHVKHNSAYSVQSDAFSVTFYFSVNVCSNLHNNSVGSDCRKS